MTPEVPHELVGLVSFLGGNVVAVDESDDAAVVAVQVNGNIVRIVAARSKRSNFKQLDLFHKERQHGAWVSEYWRARYAEAATETKVIPFRKNA